MPERSFSFNNYQFPVCARCTGIMIGEIIAVLVFIFNLRLNILICIGIMIPMCIDGTVQYYTKYVSTNIRRLNTGALFGFGFLQIICRLMTDMIKFFL